MHKYTSRISTRTVVAAAIISISALLVVLSFATVTPSGGILTDTSGPITFTGGPYLTSNPSSQATGTPTCNAVLICDEYSLTVSGLSAATTASKYIRIEIRWPEVGEAQFDLYVFEGPTSGGKVIAQNLGNQTYVDPDVVLIPAVNGTYTLRIVPFLSHASTITGTISLVPFPAVAPVSPGNPPRFSNHISTPPIPDNTAGEPSIGVDWLPKIPALKHDRVNTGGVVFFTAGNDQLRVSFNDATFPATAVWEDMNAPIVTGLDPIGWVDRVTGRVFGLQLGATDSSAAFSDNDGMTWTPFVAGGAPQGPDHETFGGGPYAPTNLNAIPPVIEPPHPLYPNAIYYCSQNVVGGAECSRSDDGGLTFGPGVDIFNPNECYGGIHGHVKVGPDGTVYVPNSSCSAGTGSQGVAVSRDNGVTWVDRTVPGSVGSGDPSVGIGSDNTVYIGYINGDNRPHIAVSTDHGQTWKNDFEVGVPVGCPSGDQYAPCRIKSAVFPVVVAGDGDRAAFGFLGSTTGGNFQDLAAFQGIWNFYVAVTYDRGAHWVTVNATEGDPVQKGAICLAGILCSSGNRNLLDFNDITVDKEGRAVAAYADGCVAPPNGTCTAPNYIGRSDRAAIVRQAGGRRLFAAYDLPLGSAVSRKAHGNAGQFDIALPRTGNPGIECRRGGPNGSDILIFSFPAPLASVLGASVTSGNGSVSSTAFGPNSNQYTVNLAGVTNAQYITVTLTNVQDTAGRVGDASATMGVLRGDVTGDRVINSKDQNYVNSKSGQKPMSSNFRADVTVDGLINGKDASFVGNGIGQKLP
jgi:hypothetical protein